MEDFIKRKYKTFFKILDEKKINYNLELRNIKINGDLDLENNKEIKKIPDNMFITGYVNIAFTKIKKLPKNLIIAGDLIISYTDIEEIPEDLTLFGGLKFSKLNNIKKVPNGFKEILEINNNEGE